MDHTEQVDAMVGSGGASVTLSSGKKVEAKKITLRTLKPVIAVAEKLTTSLSLVLTNENGALSGMSLVNFSSPSEILNLIANNVDSVAELIPLLTSVPEQEAGDLALDDVLLLCAKIMEVNADFFTQRVVPLIESMMADKAGVDSP